MTPFREASVTGNILKAGYILKAESSCFYVIVIEL